MITRIKISENFFLDEFVCREIYMIWLAGSVKFIDKRIIDGAQLLRDISGQPVTVNNWITGGKYNESGMREFDTLTGSKWSQHKYGRACDVKVSGRTPKQVHELILDNEKKFMAVGITRLEDLKYTSPKGKAGWTHMDCAYTRLKHIQIVKP